MKRSLFHLAALLALAALPLTSLPLTAQAQSAEDDAAMAGAMAALMGTAEIEPLTAEQEARLPLARRVVERIMPPGVLGEALGGMFDGMLGPLLEGAANPQPAEVVAELLGMQGTDLDLSEAEAARAAQLLDPAWQERRRREVEAAPALLGAMMGAMEAPLRDAMTELYAIHFSQGELADIDAFFATPSGAAYARQSYAMTSDPRLSAAMISQMPLLFSSAQSIEQQLAEMTADLGPKRTFADLSANERKALADMLGWTVEELQWQMDFNASSDALTEGAEAAADAAAEAAYEAGSEAGKAY